MTTRVQIVTPAPAGTRNGNRVTALRWAMVLRRLGAHVRVTTAYDGAAVDLLVAVHAIKSGPSVAAARARDPGMPVVVALAGTDLYGDDAAAERAGLRDTLQDADRIVVLQRAAVDALPETIRDKAHVIPQSCSAPRPVPPPRDDIFEVCVVGHLRAVKDPLLCAKACRALPEASRIEVVHIGAALGDSWAVAARREQDDNPRYRWCGPLRRQPTLETIARARVLVVTSRAEGGANVVSEALVCGTPVLSTRIDGSVGMLGEDYPGYFTVGDTMSLRDQLWRAESEPSFLATLAARGEALAPAYAPQHEVAAWATVLETLGVRAPSAWPPAPS
ncbi:MAG: selenoneine biosynthesis selenosugar synthase SenB [Myxococcota bacterium]